MPLSVARAFAESIAMKDSTRLRALMTHRVDFVGLSPERIWEANDRDEVVDILVNRLLPDRVPLTLHRVDVDVLADRQRVGFRMSVEGDDGPGTVEQQAYLAVVHDKVAWVRLLSSGVRWATSTDTDTGTV